MKPQYSQALLNQIKRLKKLELHAHLFGSIERNALQRRMISKGLDSQSSEFTEDLKNINFETIFAKLFKHVRRVIKTRADLEWLVESVVQNFAEDNVVYLELRTGLKPLEDIDEEKYLVTVLKKLEELSGFGSRIKCKLIISLNRGASPETASKLYKMIRRVSDSLGGICGVDFSGDVRQGRFIDYQDLLKRYHREMGLRLTIHAPELPQFVNETKEILDFLPRVKGRVGHFLHYTEKDFATLKEKELMVELCPTSNFVVSGCDSWEKHHLIPLVEGGLQKFTICTDDILLFDSNSSQEWAIAAELLGLNVDDIHKMIISSVDYTFASDIEKENLRRLLGN